MKDNRLYIRNSLFENSNDKFNDIRDQLEQLKDFSAIGFKFVSFPKLKNVKHWSFPDEAWFVNSKGFASRGGSIRRIMALSNPKRYISSSSCSSSSYQVTTPKPENGLSRIEFGLPIRNVTAQLPFLNHFLGGFFRIIFVCRIFTWKILDFSAPKYFKKCCKSTLIKISDTRN